MSLIFIMLPATLAAALIERPKKRKECLRRIRSRQVW